MRFTFLKAMMAALLGVVFTAASARCGETDTSLASRAKYRRPSVIPFPDDNPYSEAKAKLGKMLFFDGRLSGSGDISCASCHDPSLSWGDARPRAVGVDPDGLPLRSPTLIDVAFGDNLGWDGKFTDIEAVTFAPITNPKNMNLTESELLARLSRDTAYVDGFRAAFGDNKISRQRVQQALATYQRTIVAGEAPFDRWVNGDEKAIDEAAKRGFALFNGKANCSRCHSGPSLTDGSFQDIGTAAGEDIGRGRLFPTSQKLRYAFKTPTLRDVAHRSPFMHDGSLATLEDVIELYDRGGVDRPSRSPDIRPLNLNGREKADLVAFLATLSADRKPDPGPTNN